jgi:hypothetical protein
MDVDVSRALDQIAEIHQQIAKAEIYRGYRSLPVAASALIGIGAAAVQPRAVGQEPLRFLVYWLVVAACAGAIGASEIVFNHIAREDETGRRRTRQVVGQFLPAIAAGAAVGLCFTHVFPSGVVLLPGIWAVLFGLGVFASRPYLPRASGWIALYYLIAGILLLWSADGPGALSGWRVGGTFGAGQLLAALVLWWNLEREV